MNDILFGNNNRPIIKKLSRRYFKASKSRNSEVQTWSKYVKNKKHPLRIIGGGESYGTLLWEVVKLISPSTCRVIMSFSIHCLGGPIHQLQRDCQS